MKVIELFLFLLNFSICIVGVEVVLVVKGFYFFNLVLNFIIYSLMNK